MGISQNVIIAIEIVGIEIAWSKNIHDKLTILVDAKPGCMFLYYESSLFTNFMFSLFNL